MEYLDVYLFILVPIIGFMVVMLVIGLIHDQVPNAFVRNSIMRKFKWWSIAMTVSFAAFFAGWYFTDGEPLGWIAGAMITVFATASYLTVRSVWREGSPYVKNRFYGR